LRKLAEALCLERKFTPCLWQFKTEQVVANIRTDLKKRNRPGIVLEFLEAGGESLERVVLVFLSTKRIPEYRQPEVEIGTECTIGECEGVKRLKSYVFFDRKSGRCLFKIPLRFLKDRTVSTPCSNCKEELKKRLFDECRND